MMMTPAAPLMPAALLPVPGAPAPNPVGVVVELGENIDVPPIQFDVPWNDGGPPSTTIAPVAEVSVVMPDPAKELAPPADGIVLVPAAAPTPPAPTVAV